MSVDEAAAVSRSSCLFSFLLCFDCLPCPARECFGLKVACPEASIATLSTGTGGGGGTMLANGGGGKVSTGTTCPGVGGSAGDVGVIDPTTVKEGGSTAAHGTC